MWKVTKIAYRDALIEDMLRLKRHIEDKDNIAIVDGCIAMLDKIDFNEERDDE